MIGRLISIIFIYACTTVAWFILGGTVVMRSEKQDGKLRGAVGKHSVAQFRFAVCEVVR